MDTNIQLIIAFLGILASTFGGQGFWNWLKEKKIKKKGGTDSDKLIKGMAHDKIDYLSRQAIKRGYTTFEEFENLVKYLYEPYIKMGGNGYIENIISKVKKLPIFETELDGEKYLENKRKEKSDVRINTE